jgi:hypothetical protein
MSEFKLQPRAPKVFITQGGQSRTPAGTMFEFDYSKAERFGELVKVVNSQPMIETAQTYDHIEKTLADFSSNDYLLLSGDPVACAMCVMVASRNSDGYVNLLRYNKYIRDYEVVVADF